MGFALAVAIVGTSPASFASPLDARDIPIVDQRGATFALRDLHRPTAVVFIDLHCTDACTLAEGLFARLAHTLAAQRVDAQLVTLTLNPDADSPLAMAATARRFHADAARWRWASGVPANVIALMTAFHVVRVGTSFHTTFAYVLDARGLPIRLVPLSTIAETELLDALSIAARHSEPRTL